MYNDVNMEDYNYNLPEDKIAKYPLEKRDNSKLLVYNHGIIKDDSFLNLAENLPSNSLLIFNNTKVIRARLIFQNDNGARIEIFCLEPYSQTPSEIAMQQTGNSTWICTVGNLKKWKQEQLIINTENLNLIATKNNHAVEDGIVINFNYDVNKTFAEVLESLGKIPLPPYLKRNEEVGDENTYQTVYAQISGSVAAPTAGLHFTDSILNKIKLKGNTIAYTTLHVGAGTFKPVKGNSLNEHHMHSEEIIITQDLLKTIAEHQQDIVAVGTTTLRTLESIYWLSHLIVDKGLKAENEFYYLSQWAAYGLQKDHSITFKLSCTRLLHYLQKENLNFIKAKTQIIISPGYRINSIKALVTNFHQPGSTLLVLVSTLIGDRWKDVYNHALENNYRFLSYGDSSILFNQNNN